MRNVRVLLACFVACIAGSSCNCEFVPKEGDIVFCVGGTSAMSEAIVQSTARLPELRFDHVGIFAVLDGSPVVLEASPKGGVIATPWKQFLAEAQAVNGSPGIVVKRLDSPVEIEKAIECAKGFLGQEYDWSYRPDNGKIYCSELVYEAYLNSEGSHIFGALPMSFRDADGNMPKFWIDLFSKLGEEVPEGVLGTNPNDMSKDSVLVEVYRYF